MSWKNLLRQLFRDLSTRISSPCVSTNNRYIKQSVILRTRQLQQPSLKSTGVFVYNFSSKPSFVMEVDSSAAAAANSAELGSKTSVSTNVEGDTDAGNGNQNRSEKRKKSSKWKSFGNKKKKKKEPFYRNRGEKQVQDGESEEKKDQPKNNRRQDHWESKAPKIVPHEGSFRHEDMQKLFGVEVDVPVQGNANDEEEAPKVKVPKKKLGILVSFLGSNYGGFQINAGQRTLQAELELAFYRAGIISPSNFGWPSKYSWSNSARTDKGVHAAAQVISMKGEMIFHTEDNELSVEDQLNAMREKVNEYLPDDIRVLDIERVIRPFCGRTNRDKVRYQYMVPSYMLCPREQVEAAFELAGKRECREAKDKLTPMEASDIVSETITPEVLRDARSKLYGYRTTPDQITSLRAALKVFEGTHPFHNYTRRLSASDPSASRYIMSFVPLDPIVVPGSVDDDGIKGEESEWIPVQVVGQSFLLNQIRKMVSAAVDLARGAVTKEDIEKSLTKSCKMKVNVAPAQGLFLDRSFFEIYNQQLEKKGHNNDHKPLKWVEGDEIPPAVKRIEEFKNGKIIPHIVQEEAREGNFLRYLYCQDVLYANDMYNTSDDTQNGAAAFGGGGSEDGGENRTAE